MHNTRHSEQRADMRKNILFALERLLEHKIFVDISIGDICSEAHISKPTFYRYFQSKENIATWLSEEAMNCGIAAVGRKYTWFEGYYRTMCVLYRHRVLYSDPQSPALTNSLISFSCSYLKGKLIETIVEHKGVELTEKLTFQIEALNYALSYISRQWGAGGMTIALETISEYLTSIVPHDLFRLLNEPEKSARTSSKTTTPDKSLPSPPTSQ